jgi:hypothetical protein
MRYDRSSKLVHQIHGSKIEREKRNRKIILISYPIAAQFSRISHTLIFEKIFFVANEEIYDY